MREGSYVIRFSHLRNRFVLDSEDKQTEKTAASNCRSEADRLRKEGNENARVYAILCAELIEHRLLLYDLLCSIPLPNPKPKRGRPFTKYKVKQPVGAPRKWSLERCHTLLVARQRGEDLVRKQ